MTYQRDPTAWAAARAVGMFSQQLVSKLAQASSLQEVEECLSTCLQLFSSLVDNISDSKTCLAPPEHSSSQDLAPDDLRQCQQQLEPHAATVGWSVLRNIFFEDQLESWACAVLAGEMQCVICCPLYGLLACLLFVAWQWSCCCYLQYADGTQTLAQHQKPRSCVQRQVTPSPAFQ